MKKKQRCSFKRFAALVAALMLCAALCVPCFAVDKQLTILDDFPSDDDFRSHPNQWYVVRSGDSRQLYLLFDHNPNWDPVGKFNGNESTFPLVSRKETINLGPSSYYAISSAQTYHPYYWINKYPVDIGWSAGSLLFFSRSNTSYSGSPSFLVTVDNYRPSGGQFYSASGGADVFIGPVYSAPLWMTSKVGNTTTPAYVFPHPSGLSTRSSIGSPIELSSFVSYEFYPGDFEMGTFPRSLLTTSRDLALLGVDQVRPSSTSVTYNSLSFWPVIAFSSSNFEALYGSGYSNGGWFPRDDDLQDDLTNEFGVDSDKLHNSKDSLDSWGATQTVDKDALLSASNLLFCFSSSSLWSYIVVVALIFFGAVFLRLILRKALE